MKNQIKMFMFFVLSLNFKVSFKKSEIQAEINYKELQKTEKQETSQREIWLKGIVSADAIKK